MTSTDVFLRVAEFALFLLPVQRSASRQTGANAATLMTGLAPINLKSNSMAPSEENGSPGSSTPPADTGGDNCSCRSPPALYQVANLRNDTSRPCPCGRKLEGKAFRGYTGGQPVSAEADALAVASNGESGGGGVRGCNGTGGRVVRNVEGMVTPQSAMVGQGVGCGKAEAAVVASIGRVEVQHQHKGGQGQLGVPRVQPMAMVGGVEVPAPAPVGATDSSVGGFQQAPVSSGVGAWSMCVPPGSCPSEPVTVMPQDSAGVVEERGDPSGCPDTAGEDGGDTMDRLALSLAQVDVHPVIRVRIL